MTAEDVVKIYGDLVAQDICVWVDGGWCVDALLGQQTREHPDLDIAIARKDAVHLKSFLIAWGYKDEPRNDTIAWNYVVVDAEGKLIDVHVFEFDDEGKNVYGIKYPKAALTGSGTINGQSVNCIAPEWMFRFKTAYAPQPKDLQDVHALAQKYGFEIPASHRISK